MASPSRFMGTVNSSTAAAEPPEALAVDSDFVVVLAALLCALICVVGLTAVARCAWLRRVSRAGDNSANPPPQLNKGLKKSVLRSLPKLVFNGGGNGKLADCAICLMEYVNGDEIRVLPQCGHGFHVACIDMWLGSHSSCPSCRQILVVARCQKCGGFSAGTSTSGVGEGFDSADLEDGRAKARDEDPDRFLP